MKLITLETYTYDNVFFGFKANQNVITDDRYCSSKLNNKIVTLTGQHKSIVGLAMIVAAVLTRSNCNTMVMCRRYDTAYAHSAKVLDFITKFAKLYNSPSLIAVNKQQCIEIVNKSKIWFVNDNECHVRGMSFNIVFLDFHGFNILTDIYPCIEHQDSTQLIFSFEE